MKNQSINAITFQYQNSAKHDIRTEEREDGSVWFVTKDVCQAIGVRNSRQAAAMLDADERGVFLTDTPGGKQEFASVSESGLYALIMNSRKPEAKNFRKWVTSEVLPTIRKTGTYSIAPQPVINQSRISPKAITAFLQATTDTFWGIEKALIEYKMVEGNLRKARRDTSIIIRCIRDAFPECRDTVDLIGNLDGPPLEVEMMR